MNMIGPVMLDLETTELTSNEKEMLLHPACGGVILFSRNIETAEQVSRLNQSIREINSELLIAVDQEGGRVQRLKQGFSCLPALRSLEQLATETGKSELAPQLCYHHGRLMGLEVQAVGFDISFAPVLDISSGSSRVIGDRAFHERPQMISDMAESYIDGMNAAGMKATGKHFPGHGSIDADSHHEIPVDTRTFEEIEANDLLPFKQMANKLGGIMPAHIVYSKVDQLPAGFSSRWIQHYLRESVGFSGVVFSDDLSMEGATVVGGFNERAEAAILAGCDMVLVCNQPSAAEQVLEFIGEPQQDWQQQSSPRIRAMRAMQPAVGLSRLASDNSAWQESHTFLNQYFEL